MFDQGQQQQARKQALQMKFSIRQMIIYLSATSFHFCYLTTILPYLQTLIDCVCLLGGIFPKNKMRMSSYWFFKLNLYILLLIG